MNKEFEIYTNKVIKLIGIRGRKAEEIREDIYSSLLEKQQSTGENNPYKLMGAPEDTAKDFRDNMDIKPTIYDNNFYYGYEYISKTTLFGLPLVHINFKRFGVAKGIIAIGNIALGALACGGVSIGILSFGGFAIGLLFGLGGAALSALASFGGFAVSGVISFGGFALAKYFAFGGFASADIAIGGIAKGIIAIYNQKGTGQYLFESPANIASITEAVKTLHPNIGKTLLSLIKYFAGII